MQVAQLRPFELARELAVLLEIKAAEGFDPFADIVVIFEAFRAELTKGS